MKETRPSARLPLGFVLIFSLCIPGSCDQVDNVLGTLGWEEPEIREEIYGPKANVDLLTCTSLKIGILDLGAYAMVQGLPPCSMTHVGDQADLINSLHSGPLHVIEAIQTSRNYEENVDDADIVFVNDYCYYVTGAAFKMGVLSSEGEPDQKVRGASMIAAYETLLKSPRWEKNNGMDFVFYDSHTGFGVNDSGIPLDDFLCGEFRNSTILTTDREFRARTCEKQQLPALSPNRVMVVPSSPHRIAAQRGDMHLKRPPLPLEKRAIRINKRSLCPDDDPLPKGYNDNGASFVDEGFVMRKVLEAVLADADGKVNCAEYEYLSTKQSPTLGGGIIRHFDQTYSALEHSVFCIFLPGAAGMGHRLSEAIMAGCVPVFIGPPFAPMPFLYELRYAAAAVIINVTGDGKWERQFARLAKERGSNVEVPRWAEHATSETELALPGKSITVDSFTAIRETLEEMPGAEVERRLSQIAEFRNSFAFDVELTEVPNAVNHILSGICRRTGRSVTATKQMLE